MSMRCSPSHRRRAARSASSGMARVSESAANARSSAVLAPREVRATGVLPEGLTWRIIHVAELTTILDKCYLCLEMDEGAAPREKRLPNAGTIGVAVLAALTVA